MYITVILPHAHTHSCICDMLSSFVSSIFLLAYIVQVTNIPHFMVNRWYHSIAAVGAEGNCVWMMVVGGLKSASLSNYMSPVVALLELSE